jgi:tRNA U34 5-methylaminomethyl-2-thiouridine-forming methyltransferase MnmC
MIRTVQITADGSQTIAVQEMNVTYHSRHGAIQESRHVFIEAGLEYVLQGHNEEQLSVFEMGFGTGLNALLSLQLAKDLDKRIYYFSVEQFPLTKEEWQLLAYGRQSGLEKEFEQLHTAEWDKDVQMSKQFVLHKCRQSLQDVRSVEQFNLVYYDAFAPSAQPELWTTDIFKKLFALLRPGGVLVTYCSKGDVRRVMMASGFEVKKIPGPAGKREMVRAIKR